ncbi:hypothetical protein ACFO6W_09200 [Dysgonomonas termitidis]|uniref:Uncharacterized protein n=1 Tax=Dysgonomonas termitidis TaxID=1516126 RepID=A0ABV9KUS2_9BACT
MIFFCCLLMYIGMQESVSAIDSLLSTNWSPGGDNLLNGIIFYSILSLVCFFLKYLILDTWKADDKVRIVSNNKYETFEQRRM